MAITRLILVVSTRFKDWRVQRDEIYLSKSINRCRHLRKRSSDDDLRAQSENFNEIGEGRVTLTFESGQSGPIFCIHNK